MFICIGGCKHAIALLTWVHRRSEEPSVTSTTCYWKSSNLSAVGKSVKFIKAKDICKSGVEPLPASDGSFLQAAFLKSKQEGMYDTVLSKHFKSLTDVEMLSVHHLLSNFLQDQQGSTAEEFLNYCSSKMSDTVCKSAEIQTVQQSKSALWHELRYARITASKAHEAAHCHTLEGSLVETILGASSLKDSAAMMRGRKLEKDVRKEVEKLKNIKINVCGLKTLPQHPVMGASPDGISDEYVIEIKCPSTEKAVNKYIKDGHIAEKYKAQIQMQMFFCQKKQGLFCVADVAFEHSKKISIITDEFDEQYCSEILKKCTNFWKLAIFPVIKNSLN